MMGPTYAGRIDTLGAGAGTLALRQEHASIGILWHALPREGPPLDIRAGTFDWHMYGRGQLEIADAPAVEAGVARWFELAAALVTRDDASALPPDGVEVTSIVTLHRPGMRGKPIYLGETLAPRHLTTAAIDPARLVLPTGYTETRWPGFEGVPDMPTRLDTAGARWRVLEDTTSQRARAACKQAWLPPAAGGISTDTAARTRDGRSGPR
ncbi:MAG TPA: hypothetical protein VJU87_07955 [Gemmatimonadaceae bacterium]|nr:hypothetical protein [Gemmatimonadaceae bacterium]